MSIPIIHRVESRRDLNRFIAVPYPLYSGDPCWVPPLKSELRARLDEGKNPYFEHAEAALFIAVRDGRPVGRITAQVCELTQSYHGQGTGHFGWFECENCQDTADGLFRAAENWLRNRGMTRVVGPFSLSINEEVGLLIDGFDRPPTMMMGHHLPYYADLLQGVGFEKEKDVYAYYMDITQPYTDRIQRVVEATRRNRRVVVRPMDSRRANEELDLMLRMFNEAWDENWGYIPFTPAEVQHLAQSMRRVLRPESVQIAEVGGEPAGFMVMLPNLNEAIHDIDGRLFPSGWLRLLWRMKFGGCKSARVPLMGIRKQFHGTVTGAALAFQMIDRCRESSLPLGFTHCEMSWILEDNRPMCEILEALGSDRDKTYRVYAKSLSA